MLEAPGPWPKLGTWEVGRDALCPQPLLQVRVDFGDVLNGHQVFSDVLSDTAWLSQPRWQERSDLPQRVRERDQATVP